MTILIPMAGAGSRFKKSGYTKHKPVIQVTNRNNGHKIPMVVAATNDIPNANNINSKIIYIYRDFHKKDKIEKEIKKYYTNSHFKTLDYLTKGQACTCLTAKKHINNNQELIIGACDNGMVFDKNKFETAKNNCDVLIFTFRNNDTVSKKPEAYGWVRTNDNNVATDISVKIPISNFPKNDHAIVGTFWFRKGTSFVTSSEKMIKEKDMINNEFYVDQAIKHCLELNLKVKVFEIDRYICWGTPKDYEDYENTLKYWQSFYKIENWIK